MKYFSLFSGVGGFEIGINNAYDNSAVGTSTDRQINGEEYLPNTESRDEEGGQSASCIGFSEIDKYASAVLKYRFPSTTNYGDITKIDWSTIPDFDMLVGGSPCQSFSVAGKRAGFAGASGLFWEYLRCLKEKEPQYFIWENVKGCLSSNGGRDFATILTAFSEAGYSLTWQVLNAKDFGVPQNRERVFVIGTREGSPPEVLPEPEDSGHNFECGIVAGTLTARYPASQREGAYLEEAWDGETKVRTLTPIECERLMSWPDDWTKYGVFDGVVKEISDSQRYKMCGNGVVSKVIEHIIRECI